jgi:hypothetical protein
MTFFGLSSSVSLVYLIGAMVGAVAVLFVWHRLVSRGTISDPGSNTVGPRRWL